MKRVKIKKSVGRNRFNRNFLVIGLIVVLAVLLLGIIYVSLNFKHKANQLKLITHK
jgi:hypothetical protein